MDNAIAFRGIVTFVTIDKVTFLAVRPPYAGDNHWDISVQKINFTFQIIYSLENIIYL